MRVRKKLEYNQSAGSDAAVPTTRPTRPFAARLRNAITGQDNDDEQAELSPAKKSLV